MKSKTITTISSLVGISAFSTVYYLFVLIAHAHHKTDSLPNVMFAFGCGIVGFALTHNHLSGLKLQPVLVPVQYRVLIIAASVCAIWRACSYWPIAGDLAQLQVQNARVIHTLASSVIVAPGETVELKLADLDSISKLWTYPNVSVVPLGVDGKYKWLTQWSVPQETNQTWKGTQDVYGVDGKGSRHFLKKFDVLSSRSGHFTQRDPYIILTTENSDALYGKLATVHVKMNVKFPKASGIQYEDDYLKIDEDFSFVFAQKDQMFRYRVFLIAESLGIVSVCALPLLVFLILRRALFVNENQRGVA